MIDTIESILCMQATFGKYAKSEKIIFSWSRTYFSGQVAFVMLNEQETNVLLGCVCAWTDLDYPPKLATSGQKFL